MAGLYHNRADVRSHLEQFPNHQVYFYMQDQYHALTNQGNDDVGEAGNKFHDQVEDLAGEKFTLRPEEAASIFDGLDAKAKKFMEDNK